MTSEQIVQALVALGIGGVATTAVQGFIQRRKLGGDYGTTVEQSAQRWIGALEKRVEKAEAQANWCSARVTQLEQAMRDHNVPIPDPLPKEGF